MGERSGKGRLLRTTPTENSGPKFKFRLLHSLVKLTTFQNFKPKRVKQVRNVAKFLSDSRHCFSTLQPVFPVSEGFFKNRSAHFCGKSPSSGACPITNSNTLIPGAEISHEVKTDLHLWRPEFLRLPAGFRKPFQLTETRGFADHFLKISRSYSSGKFELQQFSPHGGKWSVMMSCTIENLSMKKRKKTGRKSE